MELDQRKQESARRWLALSARDEARSLSDDVVDAGAGLPLLLHSLEAAHLSILARHHNTPHYCAHATLAIIAHLLLACISVDNQHALATAPHMCVACRWSRVRVGHPPAGLRASIVTSNRVLTTSTGMTERARRAAEAETLMLPQSSSVSTEYSRRTLVRREGARGARGVCARAA